MANVSQSQLIAAVQMHPAVWDLFHPRHGDRVSKRNNWNEISRSLTEGWDEMSHRQKNNQKPHPSGMLIQRQMRRMIRGKEVLHSQLFHQIFAHCPCRQKLGVWIWQMSRKLQFTTHKLFQWSW